MPGKEYDEAKSVEEIALRLIPTYHPELATARIVYVFVDKASKKAGRSVLGKARKISGLFEYLLNQDFLIEVAMDCWNELRDNQRNALVDHLLECCTGEEDEKTGAMKWGKREADVEEFTSILARHGAWTDELSGLVEVAQRLKLEARAQEVIETIQQTHADA